MNGRHPDDNLPPGTMTSAGDDRIVPAEHFAQCPLEGLDGDGFGSGEWSICRGGAPVPDDRWCITFGPFSSDDLRQVKWILPEVFGLLFARFKGNGRIEKLAEVRRALEI